MNEKYRIVREIGKGATCIVYEGYNRSTKEKVAIKVVDSGNQRNLVLAANETRMLRRISHPNVVRMVESVETRTKTLIILERCKFSLSSVAKSGNLTYKVILRLFRDILVGLRYLHSVGVIHRDIKLGNIMISEQNELKIIDFGLSKDTQYSAPKTFCGTPDFISPEMLDRKPYTKSTDVYSAGMLVYFLLFRSDYSRDKIEHAKASVQYGGMARLLEKMLEKDPDKRVTVDEALSDGIFRGFMPEVVEAGGLAPFEIKTKLGVVRCTKKGLEMESSAGWFWIKPGMNGIWQKSGGEERYVPFLAVDSKTLKLVGFCYSVVGLVQRRTPVVVVITDRGRFFKMAREGVYVYITDEHYTVWADGEIVTRKSGTKEVVQDVVERREVQKLISETLNVLNCNGHEEKPIKVDKRTQKKGSLKQSLYQSVGMPGVESGTLSNLLEADRDVREECVPLFTDDGVGVRLAPYVFSMCLGSGEYLVLDVKSETLARYARGREKEKYRIAEGVERSVLEKVLLFEPFFNG